MKIWVYTILTFLGFTTFTAATNWKESTAKDPISGKIVTIHQIVSRGSYVYFWPSKYDAVYWPITDPRFVRFAPESGYIAFGRDFAYIGSDAKKRVAAFLKQNYHPEIPPTTYVEKLNWLARVYEVRGADDDFWLSYHCLRAYKSRNYPRSAGHRKRPLL